VEKGRSNKRATDKKQDSIRSHIAKTRTAAWLWRRLAVLPLSAASTASSASTSCCSALLMPGRSTPLVEHRVHVLNCQHRRSSRAAANIGLMPDLQQRAVQASARRRRAAPAARRAERSCTTRGGRWDPRGKRAARPARRTGQTRAPPGQRLGDPEAMQRRQTEVQRRGNEAETEAVQQQTAGCEMPHLNVTASSRHRCIWLRSNRRSRRTEWRTSTQG